MLGKSMSARQWFSHPLRLGLDVDDGLALGLILAAKTSITASLMRGGALAACSASS